MSLIIKNVSGSTKVYGGVEIINSGQHTVQASERILFASDDNLITDISAGNAVVNDGTVDLSVAKGLIFLQGFYPTEINLPKRTDVQDVPMVAVYKQEGTSGTIISYDWTDKTTWYQRSIRVTGEALSGTGTGPYSSANANWIDLTHGKLTDEDDVRSSYVPVIYDNGVALIEGDDFTIDYELGEVTLTSGPSGVITADYSYANSSSFTIAPDPGKVLMIDHTELQFSKDISFSGSYIDFDIYVYNPADLPNKILYKRKRYKNIKDIINGANLGQGVIPAVSGLTNDVCVFPFNYVTTQPIDSAVGAEIRVSINNDQAFSGEYATVTFYVHSVDSGG
jgi:hypothetical protein